MKDNLSSAGLSEIWYLVRDSRRHEGDEMVGKRGRVVSRRMQGDWTGHPFWAKMEAEQEDRTS